MFSPSFIEEHVSYIEMRMPTKFASRNMFLWKGLAVPSFWNTISSHLVLDQLKGAGFVLSICMICMGTTLRGEDVKYVLSHPVNIVTGILMQYIIMPVGALLIAKLFHLDPVMTFGLIVLGAVPGGVASNVFTFMANGDVALSISTTMCTTLLSPVLTPAFVKLFAGELVQVSFLTMSLQIMEQVVIPIFIGVGLHALAKKFVEKNVDGFSVLSTVCVCLAQAMVVAGSAKAMLSLSVIKPLLAAFVHFAFGGIVAFVICNYVIKMGDKRTRALTLETAIQNSGLAATLSSNVAAEQVSKGLATTAPAFAVPCACGAVVDQIFAAVIANYCIAKDAKAEAAQAK